MVAIHSTTPAQPAMPSASYWIKYGVSILAFAVSVVAVDALTAGSVRPTIAAAYAATSAALAIMVLLAAGICAAIDFTTLGTYLVLRNTPHAVNRLSFRPVKLHWRHFTLLCALLSGIVLLCPLVRLCL